jgi:transcriptional accessory protein Tex/SPT6
VADTKAALDGARQILMERFAEDAPLLQSLREYVQDHGVVESKVVEGKQEEGEKFADYFDYSETWHVPSHRALALLRGRREGILTWCCAWTPKPKSRSGTRRTIPAKAASPPASASRARAARPTNGCSTRRAGPGA